MIAVVEQVLLPPPPLSHTPNKHSMVATRNFQSTETIFSSKGYAMLVVGLSMSIFKSCWGSMSELPRTTQHLEFGLNQKCQYTPLRLTMKLYSFFFVLFSLTSKRSSPNVVSDMLCQKKEDTKGAV